MNTDFHYVINFFCNKNLKLKCTIIISFNKLYLMYNSKLTE